MAELEHWNKYHYFSERSSRWNDIIYFEVQVALKCSADCRQYEGYEWYFASYIENARRPRKSTQEWVWKQLCRHIVRTRSQTDPIIASRVLLHALLKPTCRLIQILSYAPPLTSTDMSTKQANFPITKYKDFCGACHICLLRAYCVLVCLLFSVFSCWLLCDVI